MSAARGTARRLLTQARAAGRRAEQSFGYGAGEDLSGEAAAAPSADGRRAAPRDGSQPRWPGVGRPTSPVRH